MIFGFNTDVKFGETVYHVQSEAREHDQVLQTQVFVNGRCLGKYDSSFSEQAGHPEFSDDVLHDLLKAQHKRFVEYARAGSVEKELGDHKPETATAVFAVTAPTPFEEERISLSFSEDPDLAAIAEASAMAALEENGKSAAAQPPVSPAAAAEAAADPMLDSFMAELQAAEKEPASPSLPQYRVEPAGAAIGKGISLDCLEPIVSPDGSDILVNVSVEEDGTPLAGAQITCRVAMPSGPAAYLYANSNQHGIADVHIAAQGLQASTPILIQASMHSRSVSRKFHLKRG